MEYRREIDGLRALAVLPVILFHAGFETFSGGYVGVDVFFVISGYLITTIILTELKQGKFSIINFYERRARRILPALFLVMFVCLPFAWLWLLPYDLERFTDSIAAVVIFISNHLFSNQKGYFESEAELQPLLHTWSLAVEEQYYLLFPLFLILTWRFGINCILGILTIIFLVSLAGAQWGILLKPEAVFYLLPTRGWELLVGAFVAFYFPISRKKAFSKPVSEVVAIIGLALVIYSVFCFDKQLPFPSFYTLVPTIGAALIILFTTQNTFVGRLLGNKVLVGIGLISYSAYLWHQPLFAFSKHRSLGDPSKVLLGSLTLVSIVLAYFSWRFVEKPFRDRKLISRRQISLFAAICSMFFLTIAFLGHMTNGFEERLSASQREVMKFRSYPYKEVYREALCFIEDDQSYKTFSEVCKKDSSKDSLLIWGDSHAAALSFGLRQVVANVSQYNMSSCPPLKDLVVSRRPQCKDANDFVIREIERMAPANLFLHANWSVYDGRDIVSNLHKTIAHIKIISPTTKITIIGSVPHWEPTLPIFMLKEGVELNETYYLKPSTLDNLRAVDDALMAEAKFSDVEFVSALNTLCKEDKCLATLSYQNEITPIAWNGSHLTQGGSIFLAKKLIDKSSYL